MVSNGRLDTSLCDDITAQFRDFLFDAANNKGEFNNFDPFDNEQRVETFLRYISDLTFVTVYIMFWTFMNHVLPGFRCK